jgi:hypothetical protein
MPSPPQALFDALRRFRASWPRRGWSYDIRVQCVASTFDAELTNNELTLVRTLLPHVWTHLTLARAGDPFVEIAKRTGGLRSNQMIFGADPMGKLVLYGLWWPWENGNTISLRIGLEGASTGELIELCEAFGAEP